MQGDSSPNTHIHSQHTVAPTPQYLQQFDRCVTMTTRTTSDGAGTFPTHHYLIIYERTSSLHHCCFPLQRRCSGKNCRHERLRNISLWQHWSSNLYFFPPLTTFTPLMEPEKNPVKQKLKSIKNEPTSNFISCLKEMRSEVYLIFLLVLSHPSSVPVCNYRFYLILITSLKRQIPRSPPPPLSPPTKTRESAKLYFSQLSSWDRLARC